MTDLGFPSLRRDDHSVLRTRATGVESATTFREVERSTRFEDAFYLGDYRTDVLDVVQHSLAGDKVELAILKRKVVRVANLESNAASTALVLHFLLRDSKHVWGNVHCMDGKPMPDQVHRYCTRSAA